MCEPITPPCVKLIPPLCHWGLEAKDGDKMSSVALPGACTDCVSGERELGCNCPTSAHTPARASSLSTELLTQLINFQVAESQAHEK